MEDASGRATGVLKEAVAYEGSSVAFIQMIAAMDHDGEIEREIKGKRTYRITGLGQPLVQPSSYNRVGAAGRSSQSAPEIDYERLAKALVRELVGHLRPAVAQPEGTAAPQLEAEQARLDDDRLDYARRLDEARRQMDELLGEAAARAGGSPAGRR